MRMLQEKGKTEQLGPQLRSLKEMKPILYTQPVRVEQELNASQQDAGRAEEDKGAAPRVRTVVIRAGLGVLLLRDGKSRPLRYESRTRIKLRRVKCTLKDRISFGHNEASQELDSNVNNSLIFHPQSLLR